MIAHGGPHAGCRSWARTGPEAPPGPARRRPGPGQTPVEVPGFDGTGSWFARTCWRSRAPPEDPAQQFADSPPGLLSVLREWAVWAMCRFLGRWAGPLVPFPVPAAIVLARALLPEVWLPRAGQEGEAEEPPAGEQHPEARGLRRPEEGLAPLSQAEAPPPGADLPGQLRPPGAAVPQAQGRQEAALPQGELAQGPACAFAAGGLKSDPWLSFSTIRVPLVGSRVGHPARGSTCINERLVSPGPGIQAFGAGGRGLFLFPNAAPQSTLLLCSAIGKLQQECQEFPHAENSFVSWLWRRDGYPAFGRRVGGKSSPVAAFFGRGLRRRPHWPCRRGS